MKAASLVNVGEVMQLAGVAAVTLPPSLLEALHQTYLSKTIVSDNSLFTSKAAIESCPLEKETFIDDEAKFRKAFSLRDGGKGKVKTDEVLPPPPKHEPSTDHELGNRTLLRISDQIRRPDEDNVGVEYVGHLMNVL